MHIVLGCLLIVVSIFVIWLAWRKTFDATFRALGTIFPLLGISFGIGIATDWNPACALLVGFPAVAAWIGWPIVIAVSMDSCKTEQQKNDAKRE